jgi:hypothetical protein
MTQAITGAIESLGTKILNTIGSLKELPELTRKQSVFIEEGFADQAAFQGGMHVALRGSEVAKRATMLDYETDRLERLHGSLQGEISRAVAQSGETSKALDEQLAKSVQELDKDALEYAERSSDPALRSYIAELELPYLEQLDADDQTVMATRHERLAEVVRTAVDAYRAFHSRRAQARESIDQFAAGAGLAAGHELGLDCYVVEFTDSKGESRTLVLSPSEASSDPSDWQSDFRPVLASHKRIVEVARHGLNVST